MKKKLSAFSEEKQKAIWIIIRNVKYRKFESIIDSAIINWKNRKPKAKCYGLSDKHGSFRAQECCCLISAALNGKKILIDEYETSEKNCNIYDFCAKKHFNLSLKEIRGLIFGFDLYESKYSIEYDEVAFELGSKIHQVLFK